MCPKVTVTLGDQMGETMSLEAAFVSLLLSSKLGHIETRVPIELWGEVKADDVPKPAPLAPLHAATF